MLPALGVVVACYLLLCRDVSETQARYDASLAALLDHARWVYLKLHRSRVITVRPTRSLAAYISVQLLLLLLQILRRILLECQILQQVLVHHGASMHRVES